MSIAHEKALSKLKTKNAKLTAKLQQLSIEMEALEKENLDLTEKLAGFESKAPPQCQDCTSVASLELIGEISVQYKLPGGDIDMAWMIGSFLVGLNERSFENVLSECDECGGGMCGCEKRQHCKSCEGQKEVCVRCPEGNCRNCNAAWKRLIASNYFCGHKKCPGHGRYDAGPDCYGNGLFAPSRIRRK